LWLAWECRLGNVRPDQAVLATTWLLRYRMGFGGLDEPVRRSIMALQGVEVAHWQRRVEDFYHFRLRHLYRKKGLAILEAHRQAGDKVVLLSSTHHILANAVQQDLHFDHLLCNHLASNAQGVFTGELDGPLCFGEGKRVVAQALCQQWHVPLSDCTFYTDSSSDLPILEAVGHPVAVNPDPRLRRRARKEGWPQVDWGAAQKWPQQGQRGEQKGR
jgi:HAD superfamily hydrolase (TIGR01490 family)